MHIGGYFIDNPIALAPMAGITDKPFRRICREFGAGWAVCEMLTSDPSLRHTKKTLRRSDFEGEGGVVAVQIAGSDPQQMAEAARYNVGLGAQVIDINMGCPAKKVCNVQAGSALMQNEPLVGEILEAVVNAVDVPVTLKTRLGWHNEHQNLPTIAKIAEESGIAALAIHGRTRTQMYKGEARYELIAETQGRLNNLKIAMAGDLKYGRTVHSLCQALKRWDCEFAFVSPPSLAMPEYITEELEAAGCRYQILPDLETAVEWADILYMTRVQRERFDEQEFAKIQGKFNLNAAMLANARPNLRVLHPLPRVDEIHPDVDATPHAYYFEQATNGVYARMAILSLVLNEEV